MIAILLSLSVTSEKECVSLKKTALKSNINDSNGINSNPTSFQPLCFSLNLSKGGFSDNISLPHVLLHIDTHFHNCSYQSDLSLIVCIFVFYIKKKKQLKTMSFHFSTEIIKKQGDEGVPDLVHVMRTLASEAIPNLPPGGELASK